MHTKSLRVHPPTPGRFRKVVVTLLLQAFVWTALAVAFATLLKMAGPQSWPNALYFAALSWMPWAVLAPLVFWFSGRFPFDRGHLWRSIPAHLTACVACVAITLWVATSFAFIWRPTPRPLENRPPPSIERPVPEGEVARSWRNSPTTSRTDRFERPDRPREPREGFGRRGPFWWPFLGTTLWRANFDAAVYLIVVIAAHALAFYRRAQERERHAVALTAGLNRAKLEALRLQLQPHFLFNTLNAISTLVHRDAGAADELIGDLSELLRLSLQTADHEVPLSRELELLDRYIAIEKTRLGDRLQVVRDIDPATTKAFVPTFMLQPLVENAVRHGIEPRIAPGTVTIRARQNGDQLQISIADDGVGLGVSEQNKARLGIGITNTEARLRALHGDAAKLVLLSPEGGGVEVNISLPFVTTRRVEPGVTSS